jgi:hypothetical protein
MAIGPSAPSAAKRGNCGTDAVIRSDERDCLSVLFSFLLFMFPSFYLSLLALPFTGSEICFKHRALLLTVLRSFRPE